MLRHLTSKCDSTACGTDAHNHSIAAELQGNIHRETHRSVRQYPHSCSATMTKGRLAADSEVVSTAGTKLTYTEPLTTFRSWVSFGRVK